MRKQLFLATLCLVFFSSANAMDKGAFCSGESVVISLEDFKTDSKSSVLVINKDNLIFAHNGADRKGSYISLTFDTSDGKDRESATTTRIVRFSKGDAGEIISMIGKALAQGAGTEPHSSSYVAGNHVYASSFMGSSGESAMVYNRKKVVFIQDGRDKNSHGAYVKFTARTSPAENLDSKNYDKIINFSSSNSAADMVAHIRSALFDEAQKKAKAKPAAAAKAAPQPKKPEPKQEPDEKEKSE